MPRERIVDSFILKRTDFGEADQIITLFTREEGKVRVLVKAAKLPTSKLQPMLQPLFQTRVNLAGNKDNGLAKAIGAQLIKAYSGVLANENKLAAWYVVSELLIRALPDSAPNETLFSELEQYAAFLHEQELDAAQVKQSVTQFQIKALASLGLGIRAFNAQSSEFPEQQSLWFSIDRGGFMTEDSVDAIPIRWELFQSFRLLSEHPYSHREGIANAELGLLSTLINRFVTHQLERDIKSHHMLASI